MKPVHTNSYSNSQYTEVASVKLGCCSRITNIFAVSAIRCLTLCTADLCCGRLLDRWWKEGWTGVAFKCQPPAGPDEMTPIVTYKRSKGGGEIDNKEQHAARPLMSGASSKEAHNAVPTSETRASSREGHNAMPTYMTGTEGEEEPQVLPTSVTEAEEHDHAISSRFEAENKDNDSKVHAYSVENFSFAMLHQNLTTFEKTIHRVPTEHNKSLTLVSASDIFKEKLTECAQASRPIMHADVEVLVNDFLTYKRKYGSHVEQALYRHMTLPQLVDRLLTKRPLSFIGGGDSSTLRNGIHTHGNFESIGTDHESAPLLLADYMSYDEIQISALLGVSVHTPFINSGKRSNYAAKGSEGSFETEGIYIGMVGARFERANVMEWQHMLVTEKQNTVENGYGADADSLSPKRMALAMWEKFYKVDRFPTFEEAQGSKDFIEEDRGLFNSKVFKERMKIAAFTLLSEANTRAKDRPQGAYVVAVGLGLGVWKISDKQEELTIRAYEEILKEHHFPHVATIEFNWFSSTYKMSVGQNPHLTVLAAETDPAKKLTGKHAGKLLVAQYAWDGNSFPGNEYWNGALAASGDPAAAACSYIVPLQMPQVNPYICGANRTVFPSKQSDK